MSTRQFSENCTACPRLADHLAHVRKEYQEYHGRPVSPFGDPKGKLIIVGLAPGMHGANRTGRPFTGDFAGILLYQTLHDYGYSNLATVVDANDGLRLKGCSITNAVKCLPPQNKPTLDEVKTCNRFLAVELKQSPKDSIFLVLGSVAHDAVLRALDLKKRDYPFRHGAVYELPDGKKFVCSYHCSRYNTQTKRLTPAMFRDVFDAIAKLRAPASK